MKRVKNGTGYVNAKCFFWLQYVSVWLFSYCSSLKQLQITIWLQVILSKIKVFLWQLCATMMSWVQQWVELVVYYIIVTQEGITGRRLEYDFCSFNQKLKTKKNRINMHHMHIYEYNMYLCVYQLMIQFCYGLWLGSNHQLPDLAQSSTDIAQNSCESYSSSFVKPCTYLVNDPSDSISTHW